MPQITINLLPPTVESQRLSGAKFQLPRGLPATIGFSVAGVATLALAVFLSIVGVQQLSLVRAKQEWERLAPKRQELAKLQAEQTYLDAQSAVLTKLVDGRITWAPHLNHISDLLPDGLWLTKVVIEPPSQLTIEGSALERSGEGMQRVSAFLNGLQADKTFTSVFNKITLQSFTTRSAGAIEVLDFAIVCAQLVEAAPVAEAPRGKKKGKGPGKGRSPKTPPAQKKK